MRPATCIDIQMVSIVCHVLNREPVERFKEMYIAFHQRSWYRLHSNLSLRTRMFDTYGLSYIDKKTKMPYPVKQLKDHEEYVQLLDMEKLKSHSVLFAPALYSNHWWLYVLDVQHKEFYIVDSVYGIAPNQNRNKLHRFVCNVLNQLRVRAGAPSILKKGTIALQLRCVDVPKQPNPTDYGDRLDGFRAELVVKLILSDENTLRVEAVKQANKMGRQVRPSAALKSPYVQVSTAELDEHR
ncbi:hypothetical protein PIB30_091738 [Stylosanthes scabra]|uniref:Ubiquitin-like protease family profile domain-containing protein n=1 Tax=Stylosanthes scabra TaxID=79078 RepID=A0ABU6QX28_9FABA|nr:hypothetical protein [Stylosanthes scabra]